jgi:hypothetical protein
MATALPVGMPRHEPHQFGGCQEAVITEVPTRACLNEHITRARPPSSRRCGQHTRAGEVRSYFGAGGACAPVAPAAALGDMHEVRRESPRRAVIGDALVSCLER